MLSRGCLAKQILNLFFFNSSEMSLLFSRSFFVCVVITEEKRVRICG